MNLLVLNCVVFQKLMGQYGSRDNRWVMTHGSYGSWVTSSMGHVCHGSLCMTHLQLWSKSLRWQDAPNIYEFVSKLLREQGATEILLFQIEARNIKALSKVFALDRSIYCFMRCI